MTMGRYQENQEYLAHGDEIVWTVEYHFESIPKTAGSISINGIKSKVPRMLILGGQIITR